MSLRILWRRQDDMLVHLDVAREVKMILTPDETDTYHNSLAGTVLKMCSSESLMGLYLRECLLRSR